MTTTAPATAPAVAIVPVGGPTQRSFAQGHVEGAPDLTDNIGHAFTPIRAEVHYFRPTPTGPWSWYATVHGTNPAGAWRYRLVTSADENLDGHCPDYLAEFVADRHPGCRRDHTADRGPLEYPAVGIRRELAAQLDSLHASSGPSAAPMRRTLTWAIGMVDRLVNERALANLAAPAETEAGDVDLSAEVAVIERMLRNADLSTREVEAVRAVVVQATESTKWVNEGEARWDMAEALGYQLEDDAPPWRDLRTTARLAATPPAPEGAAGDELRNERAGEELCANYGIPLGDAIEYAGEVARSLREPLVDEPAPASPEAEGEGSTAGGEQ